jgi:hypothetical protein
MPLLDEAANALRVLLNEPELRDGSIVFDCHSLGGVIVKQNRYVGNPPPMADELIYVSTHASNVKD